MADKMNDGFDIEPAYMSKLTERARMLSSARCVRNKPEPLDELYQSVLDDMQKNVVAASEEFYAKHRELLETGLFEVATDTSLTPSENGAMFTTRLYIKSKLE